jgi:uncharacterized protein (DUF362 family)
MKYKAGIYRFDQSNLKEKIRDALEFLDWKNQIFPDSRIWVKPNLTFPEYRPGVTTSGHFIAALLEVLKERTPHLTVFESDGGNNSYPAETAFKAHNLYHICEKLNVRLINLSRQEWQYVDVPAGMRIMKLPFCKEMLENCDMTISVPVPKMHFVTRYTGAIKNHWGTVPDSMRLRNHYFFRYAINKAIEVLKSKITIVDGEYFLDRNGPVAGDPVKMNLVLSAESPYTADIVLMDMMGVDPGKIGYVKQAWKLGRMPKSVNEVELNEDLDKFKTHKFFYKRDPVDYLATLGFYSKFFTYIVYLSPLNKFAHDVLRILRGGSREVEAYYTGIVDAEKKP